MNLWMLRIIHYNSPLRLTNCLTELCSPSPSSLPATTPPPLGHHPSLWLPPVLPAEPPHCLLMGEYYQSKAKEINFLNGFSTLIHQEKPFFSGFLFNTHSDTSNQPRIPLSNSFFSFLDLSSIFYSPKLGSQSFPKDSIHSPSSLPGEISEAATAWVKDSATFLDQRKKTEARSCCNVGTS